MPDDHLSHSVETSGRRPSRRTFVTGAAAAVGAGAAVTAGPAVADGRTRSRGHDDGKADLALVNGRILTMDDRASTAAWLTISGDRIDQVGRGGRVPPATATVDLHGATVIPGLIDSHVHFIRNGINPGHEVRIIETAASIPELLSMIGNRARTVPAGEFITCIGGWNRNGVAEKRLPTPAELDAAAPRNPIYLSEFGGGGQGVTNTAGAAFFTSHGVSVDAQGIVASTASAFAALVAVQTAADRVRGTKEAVDFATSLGLTMVHDMGNAAPATSLEGYAAVNQLWIDHELNLRIRFYHYSGTDSGYTQMQTRLQNNLNRLGDDILRSNGIGERINASTTDAGFVDAAKFVAQKGWTLTQHSLTSAENTVHIAAYQQAAQVADIAALRWSLCHLNAITDEQIAAYAALGIPANIQGYAYTNAASIPPVAGPPFRKLLDAGIRCGGGSDATNVAALNPWLMMSYMISGKNNAGDQTNDPTQSVTRREALEMYTRNSAYLSFDDDVAGSLEAGKFADLAVLTADPLTTPLPAFKRIQSQLTLVGGRVVSATGRYSRLSA